MLLTVLLLFFLNIEVKRITNKWNFNLKGKIDLSIKC